MLRGARISAEWIAPPTVAEIRAKDRDRLLAGLAGPVELEDEDHDLRGSCWKSWRQRRSLLRS